MKLGRSNFILTLSIIYALLFLLSWWILNFKCEELGCAIPIGINFILSLPSVLLYVFLPSYFDGANYSSFSYHILTLVPGILNFCILFFGVPLIRKWWNNPKGKV